MVPSGVTISSFSVLAMVGDGERHRRSGDQRAVSFCLFRFGLFRLGLVVRGLGFFYPALHVEIALRHIVVLALEDFFKATHCVGYWDLLAFRPGKHLRHAERLA